MLIDAHNEFSDSQAVTVTAISTNVIDLGPTTDNTTRDIGSGEPVWCVIRTAVAITDAGSDATLTASLESDSTADLATSATVHFTTAALAFAAYSAAGSVIAAFRLPPGNYERYLGVRYTVGSGPFTAGAIDAFLTTDYAVYRAYADRQTIDAAA
jgi:hypothetical protein